MKKIEEEHFKKHGSLKNLNHYEVLAMAESYMAYELGMSSWDYVLNAMFGRAHQMDLFTKWETVFWNLIRDIGENGSYADESSDYIQHLRLVWKHANGSNMTDSQKIQAVMAFAISLRIMDFNHIFADFQKWSPIFLDSKYAEMFSDFRSLGRV